MTWSRWKAALFIITGKKMDGDYLTRCRRIKEQLERNEIPGIEDIHFLLNRCEQADRRALEAIDLLQQSRNAFRSKQIERARKILEELL